jgi:hypothetical protein
LKLKYKKGEKTTMKKSNSELQKIKVIPKIDPKLELEYRKLDVKMYTSIFEVMKEALNLGKQIISLNEEKERTKQIEIESLTTIKKSELDLETKVKQLEEVKITESNVKDKIELLSENCKPIQKLINDVINFYGANTIIEDEKLFDKLMKMQKELTNVSLVIGKIVR